MAYKQCNRTRKDGRRCNRWGTVFGGDPFTCSSHPDAPVHSAPVVVERTGAEHGHEQTYRLTFTTAGDGRWDASCSTCGNTWSTTWQPQLWGRVVS